MSDRMKAVVLVGGEGTRLRPLTETIPKPLVPLMDRASLDFVLDHLSEHGVSEVVLSSPYLGETFGPYVEGRSNPPAVTWITESQPLGTGGAILNALAALGDGTFFALNGDILTDLDLTAMLEFHRGRDAEITIALHHVEDAGAFGLVVTRADGRAVEFKEKPERPVAGDINAGTYILEPSALERRSHGGSISIEREMFPDAIRSGRRVYGFRSGAYWLDLGTPENYLQAHFDLLEGRVKGKAYSAPHVAPDAEIDLRAHLGRWVVVGPLVRIGPDAEVDDSVLHREAAVGAKCRLVGSILGPRAELGEGASVEGCVVGEGARVGPGAVLEGVRVAPFTEDHSTD